MNYKKYLSWILVITWMAVIFLFSAQPANDSASLSTGITDWIYNILINVFPNLNIETLHVIIRKLAHFTIYLILGVLLFNALSHNEQKQNVNFVLALFVSSLYAISDEIHQVFVSGRSGQISDVLIDIIGSLIGINLFMIFNKFYMKVRIKS